MRLFLSSPRNHRHRLLRLLAAVVGVAVLGFMFVFGLIAMAFLLVVGVIMLALRQWRVHRAVHGGATSGSHGTPPPPPPGIIEGEFVVVQSRQHASH